MQSDLSLPVNQEYDHTFQITNHQLAYEVDKDGISEDRSWGIRKECGE